MRKKVKKVSSEEKAYDVLSTNHTPVWLVQGFDTRSCRTFIPDPALFRTEQEAAWYCSRHSDDDIVYAHHKVHFGVMQ